MAPERTIARALPGPGPKGPGPFRRIAAWWGPHPVLQIAAILAVIALLVVLGRNTAETMARIGVTPGFAFLGRAANFEIGESPIAFSAGDTYARAILAGLLNTVRVAVLGCLFATILGLALGVARLSGNLLLAGLVRGYIEIVRNTPLLLQLFFWISLAQALPAPRQAIALFGAVFLTGRGIFVPAFVVEGSSPSALALAAVLVLLLVPAVARGLRRRVASLRLRLAAGLLLLLAAGLGLRLAGLSLSLDVPRLGGFNIRGGIGLTPEFAALLTGLTVKFSAAIAENVRAGIQAVKPGQWEAARALGLRDARIVRLVVLPQALRVITPLTTSNYLDLVKDSSLAVAIGYPDLVNIVNTTGNTTGQAFETLLILIVLYLVLNISVSLAMNLYNGRVALKGGSPA